jgi:omega-amidase
MQDLNVCLIQCPLVWENPKQNLTNFDKRLELISGTKDIIVLPEMFSTGFTMNTGISESMRDKTVSWLKEQSVKHNCIITGSILIHDDGKYFNRLIWMRPDGDFDFYDKRHLFRMGSEHEVIAAGTQKKIIDHKGWKINLQVCYDLRFPVWSKNNFNSGNFDFDVLIYVANWPEVRSHAYKSLLVARAIENQAYVIWVNRVGNDNKNIYHTGNSMVVDPYGKIIAMADSGKEKILQVELNRRLLDDFREKFKVGLDWDDFSINV